VFGKGIGLEVNACKTKYTVMSRDQYAGRSHNIKTNNSLFERVKQFKYLGRPEWIKILFKKKLRADKCQEKLAIIRCRIVYLSVCYP
jgi:hypothetical protein